MVRGRKKGQTADAPAKMASFQLTDMDRSFWKRVKIRAAMEELSIRDLIISAIKQRLSMPYSK